MNIGGGNAKYGQSGGIYTMIDRQLSFDFMQAVAICGSRPRVPPAWAGLVF